MIRAPISRCADTAVTLEGTTTNWQTTSRLHCDTAGLYFIYLLILLERIWTLWSGSTGSLWVKGFLRAWVRAALGKENVQIRKMNRPFVSRGYWSEQHNWRPPVENHNPVCGVTLCAACCSLHCRSIYATNGCVAATLPLPRSGCSCHNGSCPAQLCALLLQLPLLNRNLLQLCSISYLLLSFILVQLHVTKCEIWGFVCWLEGNSRVRPLFKANM